MAARRIDNSPLKGYDVQTTNGGATAGKLEAGDKITLTYTDQVALGSILSTPIIRNGIIYFGSTDGGLYAVKIANL